MTTDWRPRKVYILYAAAGNGLSHDARVLSDTFEKLGIPVVIKQLPYSDRFSHLWFVNFLFTLLYKFNIHFIFKVLFNFLPKRRVLYVHLENVIYPQIYTLGKHVLVPNQEWFRYEGIGLVKYLDGVWCKTCLAQDIFENLKGKCVLTGFMSLPTSPSFSVNENSKRQFMSRVGVSNYRGMAALVSAWAARPQLPPLHIVVHESRRIYPCPENVVYIDEFSSHEEYLHFASDFRFHIFATEAEGFGHAIYESLEMGACVLLTDAPPMSEIISREMAISIASKYKGFKGLSPLFAITETGVFNAIDLALNVDENELRSRQLKQRIFMQSQRELFLGCVEKALMKLK